MTELYAGYQAALQAWGDLAQSLVSVATTLTYLTGFKKTMRRELLLADYDLAMHDKFLAYLRQKRQLAQHTVCKSVQHVKAFLRYVRDDRRTPLAVMPGSSPYLAL